MPPPKPPRPTKAQVRQRAGQREREARFERVAALARDGLGLRAIVRETGLSRNTVRGWLRSGAAPTWRKGERTRITDRFVPYLAERLDAGERNPVKRDYGLAGKPKTSKSEIQFNSFTE